MASKKRHSDHPKVEDNESGQGTYKKDKGRFFSIFLAIIALTLLICGVYLMQGDNNEGSELPNPPSTLDL